MSVLLPHIIYEPRLGRIAKLTTLATCNNVLSQFGLLHTAYPNAEINNNKEIILCTGTEGLPTLANTVCVQESNKKCTRQFKTGTSQNVGSYSSVYTSAVLCSPRSIKPSAALSMDEPIVLLCNLAYEAHT